jgi:RNA polymerase sigma factor (sigma-70 family)
MSLPAVAIADRCNPTDAVLLADFVTHRNEPSFAILVQRYGAMVHAVCRRVLGDVTTADDASQATFLLLARHAVRLQGRCVAGWLHEAAWRVARQAQRAARRRTRHERHGLPNGTASRGPEAVAAAREVGRALDEEIRRLPRIYRNVVTVCLLQDHTKAEAARLLGWPEGTVAGRLSRAKALLRRRRAVAPCRPGPARVLTQLPLRHDDHPRFGSAAGS